jgi:hypothetical protein
VEIEYKWVFAVLLILGAFVLVYTGKFTYEQFFQILLWIGSLIGVYEAGKSVGITLKKE